MPLRSVLDIEVNSTQFDAYNAAFSKYSEAVKKLPAGWNDVSKNVGKGAKSFSEMVAAAIALTYQQKQHVAAQKEADRLTRSQADRWRDIARSSKDFAGSIASATTSLLKWVSPIGVLSGLLGAGVGLFGIERLAASISGQRRSATGLGIGYGQQSAFGLNYSRFVDTQGLLSGVSGSLYNATSPGYTGLLSSGISQKFLESHNAADVSVELLHRLPGLLKGTPRNLVGARLQSLGLDNIINPEDAIRYLNSSSGERSAQEKAYRGDVGRFGLTGDQQRAWQDFQTQLERAGTSIETVFVRALTPLAPAIGRLSEAFEKAVSAFVGSPEIEKAIDRLASYIGSPALMDDIKNFGDMMAYAARKLVDVARWLGLLPSADAAAAANDNLSAPSGSRGIYSRALHAGRLNGGSSRAFVVGRNGQLTPLKIPGQSADSHDVGDTSGRNAFSVGVRNFNPTNIGYGGWAASHGATGGSGWDTGHQVAVFPDFVTGIKAAESLALNKYNSGLTSANSLISSPGVGWTPGNPAAGGNIARYLGIDPNADLQLNDPSHMQKFIRALVTQEVGPQGSAYVQSHLRHDPYYTRTPDKHLNIYDATGGNVNITQSQGAHGF